MVSPSSLNSDLPSSLPTQSEGLWYEDQLPLVWQETTAYHPALDDNEAVIQALALLEPQVFDGDMKDPTFAQLTRLDHKLDLLFDLVSQLLAGNGLPRPVPVRLSPHALTWYCHDIAPPFLGSQVRVKIYLTSRYPHPLTLPGTVHEVAPYQGGQLVTVVLAELGQTTQDWLERTVFRHHRRRVARAKHPSP